jgi:hypothetical protein
MLFSNINPPILFFHHFYAEEEGSTFLYNFGNLYISLYWDV